MALSEPERRLFTASTEILRDIEGIAIIFFVMALVLGRWWVVTLPGLLLVAIVFWSWAYADTDGAFYGDGRQGDAFWVIATCASLFAVAVGVLLHQMVKSCVQR